MDNIVHFLDANYVPIAQPVDTYSSLTYTPKWDEYGEFKFVSSPSLFASIKLAKRVSVNGKTFMLDNIKTKDASANDEMSVSGRTLEALLDKVVNPAPLRIRGNMEVQIRALVTSLAITGLQAVTKLALGTLHGYQNSIDIVVPRGSLGLWLYTTLNQRGFSYTIEYDQASDSVLFDIVQEVDRSNDQTVNEPVIFSAQKGNIENVEYSKSDTDACNFAIVYDDETGEVVYVDESNGEEKRSLIVQGKSANTASDDSLYVMIGSGNRTIYTSTNGKDFTLKYTFAANIQINDVTYSAGLFIACGFNTDTDAGIISILTNGTDWTTTYSTAYGRFYRVSYNDGLIVAISREVYTGYASIFTSYDGINFSNFDCGSDIQGNACRPQYINGFWLIGLSNATTNDIIIYRSIYGFEWERISFDAPPSLEGSLPHVQILDFVEQNGIIKAVGFVIPPSGNRVLMIVTSDDMFLTCTVETFATAVFFSTTGNAAWVDDMIVVGDNSGLLYSADGGETFSALSGFDVYDTTRFVSHDGEMFNVYGFASTTGTVKRFYSTDASTWSNETIASVPTSSSIGTYGSSTQVMSMRDIGRAALAEARSVEVIDGDILPNVSPIIGTDCNVGDITSVVDINRGIIATKRLVAAQTVIEGKKHYTTPKFGTDYLSLTKYIKKEIAKNV